MLTKDFIEAVKELGYTVDTRWTTTLYVEIDEPFHQIVVEIDKVGKSKPKWKDITCKVTLANAVALSKLVEEYYNTPWEEREEAEEGLSIEDLNYELVEEYILRKVSPLGLARIMEKMLKTHGYKDLQFNINYQGTTQNTIPKLV
ncbi:hypothetical protein [Enterococcus phage vB_EfaS_Ef7.1]|nr:hypothetical protein [Enterococcus phage vB_EfaS_Ef7.1]